MIKTTILACFLTILSFIFVINSESEIDRNSDEINDLEHFKLNKSLHNREEASSNPVQSARNACPSFIPIQDIISVDFIHTDNYVNSTVWFSNPFFENPQNVTGISHSMSIVENTD